MQIVLGAALAAMQAVASSLFTVVGSSPMVLASECW
jgi:hypothetical protein